LSKASYTMLVKIFDTWPSWYIVGLSKPEPNYRHRNLREVPRDAGLMKCGILLVQKKNMLWVIKAVDRGSRRVVVWVLGYRDAATFKKLYDKVKYLTNCIFYADGWAVFVNVLPKECHIIDKKHATAIGQDDSNMRHHLGRFTRWTKVVSKCDTMVDTSIKLWFNLTTPEVFTKIQTTALSIYK